MKCAETAASQAGRGARFIPGDFAAVLITCSSIRVTRRMEQPNPTPRVQYALLLRRLCVAALLIVAVLMGAQAAAIPMGGDEGSGALLAPIALSFLVAAWCLFDGRIRGKPPARIGLMAVVVALPIAFPVYCVWSRGLRGILLLLGAAVAFVVALTIGSVTVSLAS